MRNIIIPDEDAQAILDKAPSPKHGAGLPSIRARVNLYYAMRASRYAGVLLDSQLKSALGTHFVATPRVDEDGAIVGHDAVTDVDRARDIMTSGKIGTDYIIIEGTPSDWRAADSILSRAFGKPAEVDDAGETAVFSLVRLAQERAKLAEKIPAVDAE